MKDPMASLVKRAQEESLPNPAVRLVTDRPRGPLEINLTGPGGNVFSIIANVSKLLQRAGKPETAAEFRAKAFASGSYQEVLKLVEEYAEVV